VPELAYWFFALGGITAIAAVASLGESLALSLVLFPLSVGAGLIGVFYLLGGSGWETVGGYVTMASAYTAAYAAAAMMLANAFGRTILPLGKYHRPANTPGGRPTYPIQFELGEPGVKQGQ
jgi:succinate-acetate transporter protein